MVKSLPHSLLWADAAVRPWRLATLTWGGVLTSVCVCVCVNVFVWASFVHPLSHVWVAQAVHQLDISICTCADVSVCVCSRSFSVCMCVRNIRWVCVRFYVSLLPVALAVSWGAQCVGFDPGFTEEDQSGGRVSKDAHNTHHLHWLVPLDKKPCWLYCSDGRQLW